MNIQKEIEEIVVEQLGLANSDELALEKSFVEDLNADSLDLTELIMTVEERFNIEVSQTDAEKLATFGDLLEFVKAQRASENGDNVALAQSDHSSAPEL